jgi:hypothetical protein
VFEELLYSRTQTAVPPHVAEPTAKHGHVFYQYRGVEGAAESAAYKSGSCFMICIDGLIHRRNFGDRNATAMCI